MEKPSDQAVWSRYQKGKVFIEDFQYLWADLNVKNRIKLVGELPFSGAGEFLLYNEKEEPTAIVSLTNGTTTFSMFRTEIEDGVIVTKFSNKSDPVVGYIRAPLLTSVFLNRLYALASRAAEAGETER